MSKNELKDFIGYVKTETDALLEAFYAERVTRAAKLDGQYKFLLQAIAKQAMRGGKRMRPLLALIGYKVCGGKDEAKMLRAGLSLEIFHNYLLIHDDIMDHDDTRHGGANIMGVYKKKLARESIARAEHTAGSMAILAGDVNCGLSYEALLEAGFDEKKTLLALARLNQAVFEVAAGQQLDVLAELRGKLSLNAILKIDRYKTAGYSVTFPLQFGAILAGNNNGAIEAMARYGEAVGIAFQLSDDLLGMFGSEKLLGKPSISDLREGKQTVLMHYGFALANSTQKEVLSAAFGDSTASQMQLKSVRQILENNGAHSKTIVLSHDLIEKAKSEIAGITKDPQMQGMLAAFADYCIERKY